MIKKILLSIILILISCSYHSARNHNKSTNVPEFNFNHKTIVKVFINDGFSDNHIKWINESIDLWNYNANGNIIFYTSQNKSKRFGYKNTCNIYMTITPVTHDDERVIKHDEKNSEGSKTIGLAYYKKCSYSNIYLVTDRLSVKKKFVWTTLHELGHGIGLNHDDEKKSIMYETYNKETSCDEKGCCFFKRDMVNMCIEHFCNPDTTFYCKDD